MCQVGIDLDDVNALNEAKQEPTEVSALWRVGSRTPQRCSSLVQLGEGPGLCPGLAYIVWLAGLGAPRGPSVGAVAGKKEAENILLRLLPP